MKNETLSETFTFRLSPSDRQRIEREAKRHDMAPGEYIRACLQQDWVMGGDREVVSEVVHEATQRLVKRFLGGLPKGKATAG
jgi:hypothetical protein